MKNFIQPGDVIDITAGATLTSGQALLVTTMFGVVMEPAVSGQVVGLAVSGVFDLPKVAAQTPAVGATVYWDDTAKNVTTTVGSNTKIGVCVRVPGASDPTIRVRLNAAF